MQFLQSFALKHQNFWTKQNLILLVKVLVVFFISLGIQHFANSYVGHLTGVPVGDLILSNVPTLDIDLLVVQGVLLLTLIIVVVLILKPRYILFTIGALSLFIIVRAFFISLTHLGVDPHEIALDTNSIGFGIYNLVFNTKSDFFFSGHTGIPFLMGLIFRGNKWWSRFFFGVSALMGISVLLGHIHYSIDVFAAPFMTYSIYVLAKKFFPSEYQLTT